MCSTSATCLEMPSFGVLLPKSYKILLKATIVLSIGVLVNILGLFGNLLLPNTFLGARVEFDARFK